MLKVKQLISVLFLCILLVACGHKNTKELKQGEYNIYYLNFSAGAIVPVRYEAKSSADDTDKLIEELMEQMNTVPNDRDLIKVLDDKVTFMGYTRKDNVLYLNFDTNYSSMKPIREILARACLVKTLSQIKGIDFIGINSGEQPLSDANGNPLPVFYASEFIDTITDINSFEKVELSLYFRLGNSGKLAGEKRNLVHNINNSIEKLIIEELIKGPTKTDLTPLLPNNLKVNSISINDNTCYIDFDDSLINVLNRADNKLAIYSIVNSISEFKKVTKVQISINGNNNYKFLNDVDLSTTFDRNLDYIEENN